VVVTAILPKSRRPGRVDVYVDGAFAFDIAKARLRAHDLRVGRSLEPEQVEAIVSAERQREALDAAVALLARRPRAEREIRRRLSQRRFPPEVVEQTMERLTALRLIDDGEFARAWAESRGRKSPRGRRLLERELRANGVDATVALTAVADLSDEDAARRLALSKRGQFEGLDHATFATKLAAMLQRRGFDWEITRATVAMCWQEFHADAPAGDLDPDMQ